MLKALAPEDPGSPALGDPGWSLHQRLQPLPSAPLRPPPEAALNRLGDPLGDWCAVSTADQEREAETWKGRERLGGGAGKAQARAPEVKSENAEAPEGKGSLRYGGGTRQGRDGRAGFEARSRQTHTERDTETQNERGEYTGERHRWRQRKDPEAHRETHT